jgi:flavodoxin
MLAVLMLCALAACGAGAQRETAETQAPAAPAVSSPAPEAPAPSEAPEPAGQAPADSAEGRRDVLVAYFSATGTTKGVAEKIAAIADADLYEITAAEPYSADDLNYNDRNSRSTKEQNDKSARPEIGSEPLDLSGYTTVYLGFPIWWGEEPRIMDSFVESCSFDGVTVIPFCTSGSSGIGRSGPNMEALAGSGTWLDGKRFSGSVSEADLRSWIEGLK